MQGSGRHKSDLLTPSEVAERSGVSVATLRFYEEQGLLVATRNAGNHRRFARHTLRRIAVIRAGQSFGLGLREIRDALATLPVDRAPTKREWARLSARWHGALTERIEALVEVRDGLTACIGCGCLSLASCPIYNRADERAVEGPGARRLPPAARRS